MNHPSYCYVDTALGNVASRNHVLDIGRVAQQIPTDRREVYVTWHRFPASYLEHCQQHGSVSGYSGGSYADFLPLDFDAADPSDAHEIVKRFIGQLDVVYGVDARQGVRIYWSGAKGFHVLLDATLFGGWSPSSELAEQLKRLAKRLMGDYASFDPSIYDINRLLRLPNTQHGQSGLWKIPIAPTELFEQSIDDFRQLSQQSRQMDYPSWSDCAASDELAEIWHTVATKKAETVTGTDWTLFPRHMHDGDGRDNQAFAIARYCRKHGWPENRALELLQLWNDSQDDPLEFGVLSSKVRSTYSMDEASEQETELLSPGELADAYQAYIDKLAARRIHLGLPRVDERLRCLVPGEACFVLARTGVGKSMLAQNLIRNICTSNAQAVSVFASLEQPDSMCFERYAQMATGYTGAQIEQGWQSGSDAREAIRTAVVHSLNPHAYTMVRHVSLDGLQAVVQRAAERADRPVDVLLVDYLGYIQMSEMGRSEYEKVSNVARGLKQFAKELDLVVIVLVQVGRKDGEDGSEPLVLSSGRDTGAIEESADQQLGLYRPYLDRVDDRGISIDTVLTVQILKNRKGRAGESYDYDLELSSMRISGDGKKFKQTKKSKPSGRAWPPEDEEPEVVEYSPITHPNNN